MLHRFRGPLGLHELLEGGEVGDLEDHPKTIIGQRLKQSGMRVPRSGMRSTVEAGGADLAQGARFPMITPTTRLVIVVSPMPRGQQDQGQASVDLFDGQANPLGSWMMADVA